MLELFINALIKAASVILPDYVIRPIHFQFFFTALKQELLVAAQRNFLCWLFEEQRRIGYYYVMLSRANKLTGSSTVPLMWYRNSSSGEISMKTRQMFISYNKQNRVKNMSKVFGA